MKGDKHVFHFSRVRKLMIAVSLMATLFSAPRFFEVYVREEYDDTLNATFALVDRTSLFEVRSFIFIATFKERVNSIFPCFV